MLERLVQALQRTVKRLGDGFADHRSHQGVEDANQGAWIFADRCLGRQLQDWRQRLCELFVSRSGKGEGVGQDGADGFGELPRIVKLLLQLGDRGCDPAPRITLRSASSFGSPSSLGSAVAKS